MNRIRNFLRRENGLVAVEWVALTSGLVIGAIIIGTTVMADTENEAAAMVNGINTDADTACGGAGYTNTYTLC